MSPSLSPAVLIALLVLGAAGIGILVVVLRGSRAPGEPPSRANRIGCILFALAAVGTVVFVARGLNGGVRIIGDELYTLTCPGAEIFLDDRFVGTESVSFTLAEEPGHVFPPGTQISEIWATLLPGATVLVMNPGSIAGVGVADRLITAWPQEMTVLHPSGAVDSLMLIARIDRQATDSSIFGKREVHVWVVRVRNGTERFVRGGSVSAFSGSRTFFEKLARYSSAPQFEFYLGTLPTPEDQLVEGVDPPFWIDQFAPTAEASK